jgi:hypothetical protein
MQGLNEARLSFRSLITTMVRQDLSNVFANMDLEIVLVLDDLNTIVMRDQPSLSHYVNIGGQELEQFPQRLFVEARGYEVINLPAD